jgi:hypothetical protein
MKTKIDNAATRTYDEREQNRKVLDQYREELIKNKIENDELRKEIAWLKYLLNNRHLLLG